MDASPSLAAADLEAKLNVSTEMVYRMCRAHKWPHSRIGSLYRFTEEHYQTIITPLASTAPIPVTAPSHAPRGAPTLEDC